MRRLETLQWFGLLGAPLAWMVQHVVGIESALGRCNPARLGLSVHAWQLTAMGLAAAVILAAEAAAWAAFSATRDVSWEGDPPRGRIHFLSTAALVLGPIFLTLVLLSGLGAAAHGACSS
jgi:hypothetical protein